MENKENLLLFKELFEEGFYNTKSKLKTRKFRNFYIDTELIRDSIAGPFYSIYMKGNCDYVFNGNHENFKRIKNCEDYLTWCLEIIAHYKNKVNEEKAFDEKEEKDKQVLLSQIELMKRMSYMAFDIQKDRFDINTTT